MSRAHLLSESTLSACQTISAPSVIVSPAAEIYFHVTVQSVEGAPHGEPVKASVSLSTWIDVNLLQPENALESIDVTDDGIEIDVTVAQFWNCSPISAPPFSIITLYVPDPI